MLSGVNSISFPEEDILGCHNGSLRGRFTLRRGKELLEAAGRGCRTPAERQVAS